jgi:hypothetical protein
MIVPKLEGDCKTREDDETLDKGLSLLRQKLEENFSLKNYSFTQSLRQEIKSNIMKENARIAAKKRRGSVD